MPVTIKIVNLVMLMFKKIDNKFYGKEKIN